MENYGKFERRIPVGDIEQNKVNASFKDGLLTITLPRAGGGKLPVWRLLP